MGIIALWKMCFMAHLHPLPFIASYDRPVKTPDAQTLPVSLHNTGLKGLKGLVELCSAKRAVTNSIEYVENNTAQC